jgi:hypothetical protein
MLDQISVPATSTPILVTHKEKVTQTDMKTVFAQYAENSGD